MRTEQTSNISKIRLAETVIFVKLTKKIIFSIDGTWTSGVKPYHIEISVNTGFYVGRDLAHAVDQRE